MEGKKQKERNIKNKIRKTQGKKEINMWGKEKNNKKNNRK